ncbi:MAG TPA: restriction endonuclease subunit S, partial [Candidatus Blautia merdavium]|nr:restriction endonuclease subunit S [Candidatus Blautia merdavium]
MIEKYLPEVCKIQYGFPFDSAQFSTDEGMPLIRIRDVVRGYSETFSTEKYKEEYVVHQNDLLVGMDGEFNIAKWGKTPALLNQRVCRLIPFPEEIDKNYLFYFMPSALKRIEEKTPFVTVKHLSAKELNKIIVPLPPLDEQRRIAAVLDKVTDLIAQRRAQLDKLDLLVKSRFVEMFGDPACSTKWATKKLSQLGELNRGVSKHRPRNDPALLGGPYPLIQTGDVSNSGLYITEHSASYSELGLAQSRLWKAGTLCITIAANIAQTSILTFDSCFPDSVVGFIPGNETNAIFMHYWFGFFQKILEEQAPQVAQKNINLKILSGLDVIVPPFDLQNKFAQFVSYVNIVRKDITC